MENEFDLHGTEPAGRTHFRILKWFHLKTCFGSGKRQLRSGISGKVHLIWQGGGGGGDEDIEGGGLGSKSL